MPAEQTNQIKIERNLIIPLNDGAQLSADLYRPVGSGHFPTLLSFYPYHKDDMIGGDERAAAPVFRLAWLRSSAH